MMRAARGAVSEVSRSGRRSSSVICSWPNHMRREHDDRRPFAVHRAGSD